MSNVLESTSETVTGPASLPLSAHAGVKTTG